MSRLFKVWAVLVALLAAGVVAAQQVPSLPFSPSSGGGGGGGSGGGLACLLSGGGDCLMTGPVRAADGTAALPGVAWNNGSGSYNLGLYRSAANELSVSTVGGQDWSFTKVSGVGVLRNHSGTGGGAGVCRSGTSDCYSWESSGPSIRVAGNARLDVETDRIVPQVPLRGLDASATLPTYSWRDDTDTGIYRSGPGQIAFSTDGVRGPVFGGGTAARIHDVDLKNDTAGSGGTARGVFLPSRSTGNAPVAAPTCDSSRLGARFMLDDTDDSKPGVECVCSLSNDNTTYQWLYRRLIVNTEGWEGTGCVIP